MPFITGHIQTSCEQITWEDILFDAVDISRINGTVTPSTRTLYYNQTPLRLLDKLDVKRLIALLKDFTDRHEGLYKVPRHTLYHHFTIPKKSGGRRPIDAPNPELMTALRELRDIFEVQFGVLYHTSEFAYIRGRSIVDAAKRHVANNSRWFFHCDFSNYFGSTTLDFVMRMFAMIYPMSEVMLRPEGEDLMRKALDLCFLDGGLPQGTPISPLITNTMMIPFDYKFSKEMREEGYVNTKYADDIDVSHRIAFDPKAMEARINSILDALNAPFRLNPAKTQYGSVAGSNWVLGIMVNKDGLSVGHDRKRRLRAALHNYITDRKNNQPWDPHDVQVLQGRINYFRMIEPEHIKAVIGAANRRYNVDVMDMMRSDVAAFAV